MSERLLNLPQACLEALSAIEQDPLELSPEILAHLDGCPACREARVLWLAQEEAPAVLVPAGYFERLPQRVLRKLPARRSQNVRHHPVLWAAAAALALALGIGGYLAGRVQRSPVVEASLPKGMAEPAELSPEMPFSESDDALSQLTNLSSRDAEAVFNRLSTPTHP